ncbi:MAG TPA: alpha/beta hydrolase [Solirubrobacterales bacterium]|nr:alpha/beta hydrolase [Solirubrobacterales bacterium]
MPSGAELRQFATGGEVAIRGETVGEGPPIILCHGITATRRSVIHGSRRLERGGYTVIGYDARGHGESDPAPPGTGYGYPELRGDLASVIDAQVGGGPTVLAGHSMGAHTALGFALEAPDRVAGLVLIGPTYQGTIEADSLRYWDGLAAALGDGGIDGFVSYIDRFQGIDSAWRDSVLRFTRERMERHRHLEALVTALHELPRSRPFEGMSELGTLAVPTLVVASHDAADPGHPYAVAAEYAERIPGARLVSEAEGQSPLAWQGGRLSREIETFCAEPEVVERLQAAP